jgi:exosortase F-associated protein
MLRKKKLKFLHFFLLVACLLALAFIRFFEETLFYDPFIRYFKNDYLNLPFPDFNSIGLFFSLMFRYLLNSALSLVIIYLLFKDVSLVQFASLLYILLYLLLILMFFVTLLLFDENSNLLLFYVRRFLVQPLFLVLFVPAFYFQKKQS